jgi:hemerythrin-like domain-containing protein
MAKTHGAAESGALAMLAQDHKRVQKLFRDFEKVDRADEEALRDVVETVCLELQIHSMLEEEIFYPAVRGQVKGDEQDDLLNVSEVEHEAVEDLIARLHDLEPDDPMYYAYFSVLADFAKHHIRREEQSLFPLVEKMTDLNLDQLGEDMRVRREELFAEVERGEQESETESAEDDDDAGEVATLEEEDETEELEDETEQRDISRTRH